MPVLAGCVFGAVLVSNRTVSNDLSMSSTVLGAWGHDLALEWPHELSRRL
jgi:hypothetical protein